MVVKMGIMITMVHEDGSDDDGDDGCGNIY